jgi:hypothetical protein
MQSSSLNKILSVVFILFLTFFLLAAPNAQAGIEVRGQTGVAIVLNPETGGTEVYGGDNPWPEQLPDGSSIQVVNGNANIRVDGGSWVDVQVGSGVGQVGGEAGQGNSAAAGGGNPSSRAAREGAGGAAGTGVTSGGDAQDLGRTVAVEEGIIATS